MMDASKPDPPSQPDPADDVAAPVRRALELLVLRGVASFGVAVVAVVVTAVRDVPIHDVGHGMLPIVLAFVAAARLIHVILRRDTYDGDRAWERAAAVDRGEARLAAFVAAAVPVAWLLGLGAIAIHHTDENLGLVVVVWLPLGAALWTAATFAWLDDCRERLARSLAESERSFRAYWSGVGRSR